MANKQKKRLNVTAMDGCPPREQCRVNKKKVCVRKKHDLEMSANISLEWDEKKKGVVPKREQIGLARRQLISFLEPGSYGHNALADVLPVPKEIFDLKDLSDVLSYEVWQNHLSEEERRLLSCLLPKGLNPDAVVQALLAGENFHFGNPFMKWSSSLCLGELHPDSVLEMERSRKSLNKCYHVDLHEYHHDMIQNLQFWKGKWANCRYPGVEFLQDIWRSTGNADGMEENLAETSESCSLDDSKLVDSGDNQDSGIAQETPTEGKDINRNFGDSVNGPKWCSLPKKGAKLLGQTIELGDGAKYMSYVKVSKEQHARFRNSLKLAGNDIQPSSLSSVLGTIEPLDVQPFERFEEEESKKLRECWLKMVSKDIQEGFLHMRRRQSEKQEAARSLAKEMGQKLLEASKDDEKVFSQDTAVAVSTQSLSSDANKGEKAIRSDSIHEQQDSQKADVEYLPDPVSIHNHNPQVSFSDSFSTMTLATSASIHPQHNSQTCSLGSYCQTDSVECLRDKRTEPVENDSPNVPKYPRNLNHADIQAVHEYPFPSTSSGWVDDAHGYFNPTVNSAYAAHQGLPLGSQNYINGQTLRLLGLEADQQSKDVKKDMLNLRTDNLPFFSPYTNPDCSELLQSVFKDQNNLQCVRQQKQGLDFQPDSYPMIDRGRLPRDMRGEVVHPSVSLEMRQKNLDDVFVRESMYPGSCFTIPSRDHQQPLNQGWVPNISPVCGMTVTPETHSNGVLAQGLHTYDSSFRHGWPSFVVAVDGNHNLNSTISTDQTLYSVVSECGEISPRINHEAAVCNTSFLPPGNFGGIGRGSPSAGLCSSQPLIYSSDHDAATSVKLSNLGLMAIPPQHPRIQEQFLRSWNK